MKSTITIIACAVAATTFAVLPLCAQSERSFSQPITKAEQAKTVPKGNKAAMACPKCKTIEVADRGSAWLLKSEHPCPGCHGHWGFDIYGKSSRHGHYVHDCSICGPNAVFCCTAKTGK